MNHVDKAAELIVSACKTIADMTRSPSSPLRELQEKLLANNGLSAINSEAVYDLGQRLCSAHLLEPRQARYDATFIVGALIKAIDQIPDPSVKSHAGIQLSKYLVSQHANPKVTHHILKNMIDRVGLPGESRTMNSPAESIRMIAVETVATYLQSPPVSQKDKDPWAAELAARSGPTVMPGRIYLPPAPAC